MTRLIQKVGVKCHTEKREKRDGWVNRLVSFFPEHPNIKQHQFSELVLFCVYA